MQFVTSEKKKRKKKNLIRVIVPSKYDELRRCGVGAKPCHLRCFHFHRPDVVYSRHFGKFDLAYVTSVVLFRRRLLGASFWRCKLSSGSLLRLFAFWDLGFEFGRLPFWDFIFKSYGFGLFLGSDFDQGLKIGVGPKSKSKSYSGISAWKKKRKDFSCILEVIFKCSCSYFRLESHYIMRVASVLA